MLNNLSDINNRQIQTILVCACAFFVCLFNLLGIDFGSGFPVVEFFNASKEQSVTHVTGKLYGSGLAQQVPELPLWLMYLLGGLILFFGVPHGALDLDLATRKMPLRTWAEKFGFMLLYSLLAVICVVLWYFLPAFMLSVFLTISIWHFAADWEVYVSAYLSLLTAVWILTLPALLQPEVFVSILAILWISPAEGHFFQWMLSTISVICTILILLNWRVFVGRGYFYILELTGYVLLLMFSHILVFFTVYFCIVHSASYLMAYYKNITQQKLHLVMQITGIMLLTLTLGTGIVFYSQSYGIETHFYTWLFVGLFALTAPHMLLVERYFRAR